jgi:hypothetical protein
VRLEDRFEVFPDPLNSWIIWDLDEDDVAEADNQRLEFLSETKAHAICSLLNSLASKVAV